MYDYYYLVLVLPAFILSLIAQAMVQGAFNKYQQVRNHRGMTGAEAARKVLDAHGLYDVSVEHIPGHLNDHYDPRAKVIRLSDATYNSDSVAAVGVACHEAGHAVQHAQNYAPIQFRNALVPVANLGSQLAVPLIIIGFLFDMFSLVRFAIVFFSLAVLFQIVTLPVEFNASRRAIKILQDGYFYEDEVNGVKKVLSAAALTYVAAAAVSIAQLLRLIFLSRGRRRN
ncbi:MAG: zinc metallopeptidase [Clostridiaceae bacterium]|nr:zinc metallopeptidase [Clostridiaceae bacterium]